MARNQEKAQSMMNRYLKGKQDELAGPKKLRPFLASECIDLHEADKWHNQIVREISRKVSEIQNAGLGEHKCARPAVRWHELSSLPCVAYASAAFRQVCRLSIFGPDSDLERVAGCIVRFARGSYSPAGVHLCALRVPSRAITGVCTGTAIA